MLGDEVVGPCHFQERESCRTWIRTRTGLRSRNLLVVIYGFLSLPKLPQAHGQPLASPHVGAGLQNPPEMARLFLERLSSQRPLSGLNALLVELPGFLQTPGVLLGQ